MENSIKKAIAQYGGLMFTSLLAVVTFFSILKYVLLIPFKYSRNYNEGWNALNASNALGHQALYPALDALTSNNYPPLSFYLVGGIGTLIGDNIIAGRIISLISLLFVSIAIGTVVYWDSKSRISALFSSLIFLAYMGGHYQEYMAVNDPQLLSHGFQWVALLLILKAGYQSGIIFLLSLLCLCVSLLIKHNLLALPIAMMFWLFIYNRKGFYVYLMGGVVLAGIFLGLLHKIYGDNFFTSLLRAPRIYSLQAMVNNTQELLTPMLVMVAAGIILIFLSYSDRYVQLIVTYTSLAAVFGTFFSGGNGVAYNVFFDVVIGLSVICGLTVARFGRSFDLDGVSRDEETKRALTQNIVMLTLSLSVLITVPISSARFGKVLHRLDDWNRASSENIEFIRKQQGPIMCETLAFCYWAGKPFEVDVFNVGQKLLTGVIVETKFTKLFKEHYFSAIHIEEETPRLPKSVLEEIFSNYEIHHKTGSDIFLVPKK